MIEKPEPPPEPWWSCGICGSESVIFDRVLDMNICLDCGAHETFTGWQARIVKGPEREEP